MSDEPAPASRRGLTVLPAGPDALLLEVSGAAESGIAEVLALHERVRAAVDRGEGPWPGVRDVVPAVRTVLLHTRPGADLPALGAAARALAASPPPPSSPPAQGEVEIVVRYDGADLAEVAAMTGLDPAEVVRAHTSTLWRVAFGGFVPGFGYLVGGDPRLQVPRRESPRTRVPAGSVALAGEFTGVYPRASPGGWQLIGTTDAVLWDPDRSPPAVLTPGTRVRFVDIEASR